MKRGFTLAGTVIGTVFSALSVLGGSLIIFGALGLFALGVEAGGESGQVAALLLILAIPTLIFSIVCLVLNAVSIKGYKADHEKYERLKGTIIATIVFNFLDVIFSVISLATTKMDAMSLVINILVLIALVAANVFMIVDLCIEKKRVVRAQQIPQAPQQ